MSHRRERLGSTDTQGTTPRGSALPTLLGMASPLGRGLGDDYSEERTPTPTAAPLAGQRRPPERRGSR